MELVPYSSDPNPNSSPPWSDMFRSASLRRPPPPSTAAPAPAPLSPPPPPPRDDARLALYIAMAHGGLALSLLLLYALHRLLLPFLRPLQWALLLSIPLRHAHQSLLAFLSPPLRLGIVPFLLAPFLALLRAAALSLADARSLLLHRRLPPHPQPLRFRRILRWLLTFSLFVLFYEQSPVATLLLLPTLSLLSTSSTKTRSNNSANSDNSAGSFVSAKIQTRLPTIIAFGLIFTMLVGLLTGGVFFSYKIGVEGKDAVISLKSHVQSNNYAERMGFKKWMEENDVPGLVDRYSGQVYETVWVQVESMAVKYNLTEFTDGFRGFLVGSQVEDPTTAVAVSTPHPYSVMLQSISVSFKNREWGEIYKEVVEFLRELLVTRDDLVERAKGVAMQGMEMSKRILSSSTTVLGGSANLMFSVGFAVVSGAAEVLNFVSQLMVFLWVMYFLITSESGGATEQVVGMLPVSQSMRDRCVEVIDHAISSVLLATAKIAMFQGCLTWLLFRLCSVHFLYMSTALAFISPLFPLFPTWLSSVPAVLQLLMEGRYILAVGLAILHLMLMEYGTSVIQADLPGYNAYLTGLSILGGITLFPNALEGAIMGPLILTLVTAMKNLYAEFVLADTGEKGEKAA